MQKTDENQIVMILMKEWIFFGEQQPKVGQSIEIKIDNEIVDYGTLKSIVDIKSLPLGSVVFVHESLKPGKAWSLSSERFVNSIVRDSYYWRTK